MLRESGETNRRLQLFEEAIRAKKAVAFAYTNAEKITRPQMHRRAANIVCDQPRWNATGRFLQNAAEQKKNGEGGLICLYPVLLSFIVQIKLPVLAGSDAFILFESACEADGRIKPHQVGNILNRTGTAAQKLFGMLHPHFVDMVEQGEARILFEKGE